MKLFLLAVACLALSVFAAKEDKKCQLWLKANYQYCLDNGWVRAYCDGDPKPAKDSTYGKRTRKYCNQREKRYYKNCGQSCENNPTEAPIRGVNCWDGLQQDYSGNQNTTISGIPCQSWTSQSPQEHSRTAANYPNKGLGDHNYCRNPDGEPSGAWCYTTNSEQRWDYCGLPKCKDHNLCFDGLQKDYRGPREITESGVPCQKWTEQSPQEHTRTPTNYPNASLEHNYCRNPDDEPAGAWCYTTQKSQRWDYCAIERCDVEALQYCFNGLQKDYRGPKQTTVNGLPCQKWTSQSPHAHSITNDTYPDTGLGDHNYCRNPDDEAGGAWCYTTDANQRWDYCAVIKCNATQVFCFDGLQEKYRGPKQTTVSGLACQKWTSQSPHTHSRTNAKYPDTGLGDHNYCRNPDGEPGGAWCYTTDADQRWDYCGVSKCAAADVFCFDGLQKDYRGPKQTTVSGLACQKWTSQSPHAHRVTAEQYPDTGLGDHNYCRNPDGEEDGAWCYTTDAETRWENCGVTKCSHAPHFSDSS